MHMHHAYMYKPLCYYTSEELRNSPPPPSKTMNPCLDVVESTKIPDICIAVKPSTYLRFRGGPVRAELDYTLRYSHMHKYIKT